MVDKIEIQELTVNQETKRKGRKTERAEFVTQDLNLFCLREENQKSHQISGLCHQQALPGNAVIFLNPVRPSNHNNVLSEKLFTYNICLT